MTRNLEIFLHFYTHALRLVEHFGNQPVLDLVEQGLDITEAREYRRLWKIYYGQSQHSRRQREARELAIKHKHSRRSLLRIEQFIKKLDKPYLAWKMRTALLAAPKKFLRKHAEDLLNSYNAKPRAQKPKSKLRIKTDKNGKTRIILTAESGVIAPLTNAIKEKAGSDQPEELAQTFLRMMKDGVPEEKVTVVLGLWLDEYKKIEQGTGDDLILTRSDGATMTGAQAAQALLAEQGYVVLLDPVKGPLNLYRTQRHASHKQRLVMSFLHPTCVAPGCNKGSKFCQAHHVHAWKNGGETNITNLVPLCKFHNGRNDDDPGRRLHGRIEMVGMRAYWRSPRNGRLMRNRHRTTRYAPLARVS